MPDPNITHPLSQLSGAAGHQYGPLIHVRVAAHCQGALGPFWDREPNYTVCGKMGVISLNHVLAAADGCAFPVQHHRNIVFHEVAQNRAKFCP